MAHTKKKKGCIIAIIIAVVVIAGLVVLLGNLIGSTIQSNQVFPFGEVAVKDLSSYVNVSGTVASSETIQVNAELQEKITVLNVKVGDSVKKGDVLCEFDTEALQAQFDRLSADTEKAQDAEDYHMSLLRRNLNTAKQEKTAALNQANQAIRSAEAARDRAYDAYNNAAAAYDELMYELDEADEETADAIRAEADDLMETMNDLYPQLGAFDDAVTAAYNAYREAGRTADLAVQAAQDAIDAEQYTVSGTSASDQLKELQEQIDRCIVLAPADGVVTQINIAEGSVPMMPALMVIENTESLMIQGKIGEADILRIAEGMPCEIKTTATDQKIISGTVSRIERFIPASEAYGESAGYTVEISIDDPDNSLLIGMSANTKIILDKVEQVLSVPFDAIRGGENEGYFVFVCVPTDTAGMVQVTKKSVETGFEGDFYTELKSGDLKEGDIVLTGIYGDEIPEEGSIIPNPSQTAIQ